MPSLQLKVFPLIYLFIDWFIFLLLLLFLFFFANDEWKSTFCVGCIVMCEAAAMQHTQGVCQCLGCRNTQTPHTSHRISHPDTNRVPPEVMWPVIAVRGPLFISQSSSTQCQNHDWKYEFASHSNLKVIRAGKLWPFSQRWIIQKSWIQLKRFLMRAHNAAARWLDIAESPCAGSAEVRATQPGGGGSCCFYGLWWWLTNEMLRFFKESLFCVSVKWVQRLNSRYNWDSRREKWINHIKDKLLIYR